MVRSSCCLQSAQCVRPVIEQGSFRSRFKYRTFAPSGGGSRRICLGANFLQIKAIWTACIITLVCPAIFA